VGFALFVVVNIVLFTRPTDLTPGLADLPVYEVSILACLAVSLLCLPEQLTLRSLLARPLTICVIGLMVSAVLSHLAHFNGESAFSAGIEFFKMLLYYLLMIGLLDSSSRLCRFLFWVIGSIAVITLLALLNYHEYIDVPALKPMVETTFDETGDEIPYGRLTSTGLYGDPNDFSLNLVLGMAVCLFGVGERRWGVFRFAWLVPLGIMGYGLVLTHSRGGFLALLAGSLVFLVVSFRGWKILLLLAIVLPVLFVAFRGRQTELSLSEGTSQQRIGIWYEGIELFRRDPLFGIGRGNYVVETNYVAHNSFLHCFTELGFFGGALFLGAFTTALWGLYRLGPYLPYLPEPQFVRLRPYLIAMIASYVVGMLSLSRCYVLVTYTVLGLAGAYFRIACERWLLPGPRFDIVFIQRMILASVAFLASTFVFVRVFTRWD
jgi:O-antigen ligase